IAAGFNRCGPVHQTSGNLDAAVLRQEVLTEMTGTVGSGVLALTIGCARCHNHKFDPIPISDYYRLQAFFSTTAPKEVDLATPAERSAFDDGMRAWEAEAAPLRQAVNDLDAPYRQRLTEEKKARLEPAYRDALAIDPKKR